MYSLIIFSEHSVHEYGLYEQDKFKDCIARAQSHVPEDLLEVFYQELEYFKKEGRDCFEFPFVDETSGAESKVVIISVPEASYNRAFVHY